MAAQLLSVRPDWPLYYTIREVDRLSRPILCSRITCSAGYQKWKDDCSGDVQFEKKFGRQCAVPLYFSWQATESLRLPEQRPMGHSALSWCKKGRDVSLSLIHGWLMLQAFGPSCRPPGKMIAVDDSLTGSSCQLTIARESLPHRPLGHCIQQVQKRKEYMISKSIMIFAFELGMGENSTQKVWSIPTSRDPEGLVGNFWENCCRFGVGNKMMS